MLFFRRCFFLSVSGDEEPTSLVEEELDTPSTAESGDVNADRDMVTKYMWTWRGFFFFPQLTNTLGVVGQC